MSDLTPTAQEVLIASAKARCLHEWYNVNDPPCHPSDEGWNGCIQCVNRSSIAATLRAAADLVVPEGDYKSGEVMLIAMNIRLKLLAIADELQGC